MSSSEPQSVAAPELAGGRYLRMSDRAYHQRADGSLRRIKDPAELSALDARIAGEVERRKAAREKAKAAPAAPATADAQAASE